MRRWRIALAASLLAAGLPAMAQALVYTMVATPLVVAQGDVTDFSFTFTNLDTQPVRCAEVLFPDEFSISGLGTPSASNGLAWSASLSGQWVVAKADKAGNRLSTGQSVTFTVSALATTAGSYTFDYHVHIRRPRPLGLETAFGSSSVGLTELVRRSPGDPGGAAWRR
ncbi:MAG: hypothetical protein HYX57_12055 [Chloroflexi bacterium]|nr:hypothetical protein [Chloroflexota bacterium]